jgi:hypothetical protein
MKKTICIIIITCLTSCATYRPIVDMRGINRNQYEYDLAECQEYAKRISPETSAVVGAGAGAAIGAVVGLVVGSIMNVKPGRLAGLGAALGGMQGAAKGGAGAGQVQIDIIKNCMAGRGYSVLK